MAASIAAPLAVEGTAMSAPAVPVSAAAPDAQAATTQPVQVHRPVPATARAATMPADAAQPAQAVATRPVPAKPGWPMTTHLQPGTPGAPAASPATAGSIGGAVLALFLVIGLILLLGWVAKRLPGIGGATNAALRVVGTLSLGPRERVVVVAVGDTQLLLGTGSGGTRVLHTLREPLPVAAQKTQKMPPAFAQVLAQHFGRKPA